MSIEKENWFGAGVFAAVVVLLIGLFAAWFGRTLQAYDCDRFGRFYQNGTVYDCQPTPEGD